MSVGSGLSSRACFAWYDRDSRCWRTSQGSLVGEWETFSETWPSSGTMRSGECFRQPRWGHHTSGVGSSWWPTPTVNGNYNRKGASKTSGDGLATAVNRWPTPRAFMHKDGYTDRGKSNLGEVIGGPLNPTWVEWLMGYPLGWTDLEHSETPSSPK